MKISYDWIKKYFDSSLPSPEKCSDLFTFHVFEVEGVENKGDDTVFDLKILPDRAHYALCHLGIAREISAISGLKIKKPVYEDILPRETKRKISVTVDDDKFCPRYMARVIENIQVKKSPSWLSEKLEAIGARSINSIVDATNYIMFDIGQPLHAFDADEVKGNIQVRKAKQGEKMITLDGKEIVLNSNDSVIADQEGVLAIAGVKGGIRAEVNEKTKNIILESANFDAASVRKTGTRVGIKNDAVKRYENNVPKYLTSEAIKAVSSLISEISASDETKYGEIIDVGFQKAEKISISIEPAFINAKLGAKIDKAEMVKILKSIEVEVKEEKDLLVLHIPEFRLDLKIKEDIVEEIGRLYGYDKIEGQPLPPIDLKTKVNPIFYFSEKIKNILRDMGFFEAYLYSFVPKGEIELEYPLSADKSHLRTELRAGLSKSVKEGILQAELIGIKEVKMFEIGSVFKKEGKRESVHLAIASGFAVKKKGSKTESIEAALNVISEKLGKEIKGEIKSDGTISSVEFDLETYIPDLPLPDNYDDLKLERVPSVTYKKFSLFPFMVRDVAVFVPTDTESDVVFNIIMKGIKEAGAEDLLVRHSLFDVFEKEGKKSYAFRLVFQAYDRTLTDGEANSTMEMVHKTLSSSGWTVR